MQSIRFEEYSPDGTRRVLGGPVTEETLIGRSPRSGITLARASVSREHGVFVPVGSCWCYMDIGSTNGSWIDGKAIKKGQFVIVRPGDKIQLADTFVMVARGEGEFKLGSGSVLCLEGGFALGEIELIEGERFSFGGISSVVPVPAGLDESLYFFLEMRADGVYLRPINNGRGLQVNSKPVADEQKVFDRDRIQAGDFQFLVNIPKFGDRARAPTVGGMAMSIPSVSGGDMEAAKASTTRLMSSTTTAIRAEQTVASGDRRRSMSPISTFGQIPSLPEESDAKMDKLLKYKPGQRGQPTGKRGAVEGFSRADKLYIAIGVIVLVGIILLIMFYLLSLVGLF